MRRPSSKIKEDIAKLQEQLRSRGGASRHLFPTIRLAWGARQLSGSSGSSRPA